MTFWLVLALMTVAATLAAIGPLLRRAPDAGADNDLAVYRDQLAEIDRDLALGALAPAEAEAARIEVSRRLIAAADRAAAIAASPSAACGTGKSRPRSAFAAALVALPLGAIAFYLAIGSPGLPGQPLAERLARARIAPADDLTSLTELVRRVETHLDRNPGDGRGWEVLAPVYMRLERYDDAVKARRNAARLLGETSERIAALGEAMVAAAGGIVTPTAKTEFERAQNIDPANNTATLYIGLAAKQAGQREEARRIWEGMISRAPEGAEWIPFVRQAIAALGEADAGSDGRAGPSGIATPSGQPAELAGEQRELARGMVERLAARLAKDGSDVDAWLRLVRSYLVLGERDKARAAASDARRALAGEPDKLHRLDSGVKALGVEG